MIVSVVWKTPVRISHGRCDICYEYFATPTVAFIPGHGSQICRECIKRILDEMPHP